MYIIWFAIFACASISNTKKLKRKIWGQTLSDSETVDSVPNPLKKTSTAAVIN